MELHGRAAEGTVRRELAATTVKTPPRQIDEAQICKAQAPQPWDIGNGALYAICREHPGHTDIGAVASKIWLIGRSYAASIERHKKSDATGEDFILDSVAPRLIGWRLDSWLEGVPRRKWTFVNQADLAVTIHGRLLKRLGSLLSRDVRSFASKYLHFHCREFFPIYDSRAVAAIRSVTPDCQHLPPIRAPAGDDEYQKFCTRLRWLLLEVRRRFGIRLTLREVDNLLLAVHRGASSV